MDIDYAESPPITNTSTPAVVALYERCERSNPLNMMFIKPKIQLIYVGLIIRGGSSIVVMSLLWKDPPSSRVDKHRLCY